MTLRNSTPGSPGKIKTILGALLLAGGLTHYSLSQVPPPAAPIPPPVAPPIPAKTDPDTALVLSLLGENLSKRTFAFSTVAEACSGKQVLPLTDDPPHKRVTSAIGKALKTTLTETKGPDSPVGKLRSINEVSKFVGETIQKHLSETPGIKCEAPQTRSGEQSSYPHLRIVDEESKLVFYLDPKLIGKDSADTSFRTFDFEPNNETLKITDDAVHLLVGIEHDGNDGAWTFTGWRLIDLSKLKVRLKAEFQAINADLYQKTELSLPDSAD